MLERQSSLSLLLALVLASAARAVTIYPVNNGFESPDLGKGGTAYGYAVTEPYGIQNLTTLSSVPGWTFTGTTGLAANGSDFGVNNATNGNSDGTTSTSGQAGFIQNGYGTPNTISQSVTLPYAKDSVTFSIEDRGSDSASVDVTLGSVDLGTYTPLSGSKFNTVTTLATFLTPGTYTLTFTGVDGNTSDNTNFIDNVSVTSIPEPAAVVTLALGVLGLVLAVVRQRRLGA